MIEEDLSHPAARAQMFLPMGGVDYESFLLSVRPDIARERYTRLTIFANARHD